MNPFEGWDPRYIRMAARAIRPRRWLRVHIPLTMPEIEYDRTQWLAIDAGDGRAVTIRVRPENVVRSICYFDQVEQLLAPDQAETAPVEPLAHALGRLSRGDEA